GGTPRTADESLELAAFHQLGELQARPLSDTEDLSLGQREPALVGDAPHELVRPEAEGDLRDLEAAARPVDPHPRAARTRDARHGHGAQQVEPVQVTSFG